MLDAAAANRALDRLSDPCSEPYTLVHTADDKKRIDASGGAHLPVALGYTRYAADYLATGVAKAAALPVLCSAGAANRALRAPGAQRALVLVVPEAALVGGALWGAAGLLAQGGCAAGCMLGAGYHVSAAGFNGARKVVGRAATVAAQAVVVAANATQQAVSAAWNGIRQGLQGA